MRVSREGHWACGWIEWIGIHESDTSAIQKAEGVLDALEAYPVVDDDDFTARENDAADGVWRDCYSWQDRIDYIRKYDAQFDFRNFADMLNCVRGKYFAGYASELLN